MKHFAPLFGEKQAELGPTNLIEGLTTSRFLTVKPLSTNRGSIIFSSPSGANVGRGFIMEASSQAIRIDLGNGNDSLQFAGTLVGNTICYIRSEK